MRAVYNVTDRISVRLDSMSDKTRHDRHFVFVLVPGFSLLALACAVDVLRAANRDAGEAVYDWRLVSVRGGAVQSSSGLPMQTESIAPISGERTAQRRSVFAVCGGDTLQYNDSVELIQALRRIARRNVFMGSISDGAFLLASAGLFSGYRSTIHWKCLDAYRARFPELAIQASILEIDRNRFSCAGGTASLDLFLQFVLRDFGSERVASIADNYFHDTVRDSSIDQDVAHAYRYANLSSVLAESLRIMSMNLEQPLSISDIAERSGTTHRSLDRLFARHIGHSPAQYLRMLRLNRAANLLLQTGMPISEVALSSGFSSASHLGLHFKVAYNMTPRQFRLKGEQNDQ